MAKKRTAFDLLSFNYIKFKDIANIWPELSKVSIISREQLEIEAKYKDYLNRQKNDISDFKKR